jgi:hypothetical protein
MRACVFDPIEQRANLGSLVGPLPPPQNALSYREFPLLSKHLPHVQQDRALPSESRVHPPRGSVPMVWDCLWADAEEPPVGITSEPPDAGGAVSEERPLCLACSGQIAAGPGRSGT